MHPLLERVRDRSMVLLTLNYGVGQVLYRIGARRHSSGTTHSAYSVAQGTEYVQRVFGDYLRIAQLTTTDISGKRVLEIGPGDNLGVALQFAAHAAAEVTCLDRFSPARDEAKNRAVYAEVLKGLGLSPGARIRGLLGADGAPDSGRVRVHSDLAIEQAASRLRARHYDLIVSRAVLEHVFDLDQAWHTMDALLAPGGLLVHKVDFRNHGFYGSLHPLAFLEIPAAIWNLVSAPDPTLNRRRTSAYESLAARYGYECAITVTHLAMSPDELPLGSMNWPIDLNTVGAQDELRAVRGRLASTFKSMSLPDLAVAGIFIVARKPGGPAVPAVHPTR